jgi:hypothetical protein
MTRIVGALIALILSVPQAHAANETDLALGYAVYVGGVRALSLGIDIDTGIRAYDMKLALKTEGLIGRMFPWSMDAFSRGRFADDSIRPASAGQRSLWNGKERATNLAYQADGTVAVSAIPPQDDAARPAVPAEQTVGTVDLVSAILAVLKHVEAGAPCQASVPVFDGRRRYDFTARPLGNTVLRKNAYSKFEGEAMACRVFVRPVNGFTPRRNIIDLTNENALTVWIARLQPDLPPVPVKLDMDTDLGAIRAHIANARRGTDEVPLGRAERKS